MGVILHSTRSGKAGRVAEFDRTVGYMMQHDTVSSHRVIGVQEGQHAQMVENGLAAWAQGEDNAEWLSIEFAQPLPTDEYSDYQYECGAAVVREWARLYGFPLDRRRVIGHSERPQGKRAGKSDPGLMWHWGRFMELLR